jgi:hypothetical protein
MKKSGKAHADILVGKNPVQVVYLLYNWLLLGIYIFMEEHFSGNYSSKYCRCSNRCSRHGTQNHGALRSSQEIKTITKSNK